MRRRALVVSGLVLIISLSAFARAMATDYRFHVSCQTGPFVVLWSTGAVDPGKEYLRVVTGTKNPNCQVSDYNSAQDARLRVDRYSDAGGVVAGIPFVGPIICGIFGC